MANLNQAKSNANAAMNQATDHGRRCLVQAVVELCEVIKKQQDELDDIKRRLEMPR